MQAQRRQHTRRERSPDGRHPPLRCFANFCPGSFFIHQDLVGKDGIPAVEVLKGLGGVGDELTIFLCNDESFSGPCEAEAVQEFCTGVNLHDVEVGVGEAGSRKASWVDGRNSPHLTGEGNSRNCSNMLTATGLLRYLKNPRYNHGNEPNTERLLIYIADLTPAFILALAATVPFLEAQNLRDAICKHVTFQPSIRANMPSNGPTASRMSFHLPFFALRNATSPLASASNVRGTRLRERRNLSLLKRDSRDGGDQTSYWLYPAQISCIVSSFNEWQYTTWAFVDTEHDSHDSTEANELFNWHDDDDAQELQLDPLISKRSAPRPAKLPIWKPRQYFIKALEISAEEVCQEWRRMTYSLEVDKKAYERAHPLTDHDVSRRARERGEEMQKAFDWIAQRVKLLNELIGVLFGLMSEWNTFISRDGDWGYFRDLDEFPTNSQGSREPGCPSSSLRNIKQMFENLEEYHKRLESLKDSLIIDFEVLKLRFSVEGNHQTEQASFTSTFLIWVLYPITLTVSIFSMQPAVIPFDLTKEWLCLSVFILIGVMSVIYWIMKKWELWEHYITAWIKTKQIEADGHRVVGADDSNEVVNSVSDLYSSRVLDEEETLGTRALRGSRDND